MLSDRVTKPRPLIPVEIAILKALSVLEPHTHRTASVITRALHKPPRARIGVSSTLRSLKTRGFVGSYFRDRWEPVYWFLQGASVAILREHRELPTSNDGRPCPRCNDPRATWYGDTPKAYVCQACLIRAQDKRSTR